jgi:hypothetical protein
MVATIEKCVCMGITTNPPRKDGKVYESVHLFIDGEGGGDLRANLGEDAHALRGHVTACRMKEVRAKINVREFKGSLFVDLVSVEPLTGTTQTPLATGK